MARRNTPSGAAIPMESGERDRAVTLEQMTESNPDGFPVETWTTLASPVWMRKMDMRGDEKFRASQLSAPFDTQWEMGYRADMDPDLVDVPKYRRIIYQGRRYDIVTASQIGRLEGIELLTLAGSTVEA